MVVMESSGKVGRIQDLVREIIQELGEDPNRHGLVDTPRRVEEALRFLTSGYQQDPAELLRRASFVEEYDEMVVLRDLEVYSLCEHHLLPFFGKCHVAYIPSKRIIGLSKVARLVDLYARRLQVQERLTTQIAETLQEELKPQGVGVVMEAQHLCMILRGVQKQHSVAVTSHMLGIFRSRIETRMEFLRHINRSS